MKIEIDSVELRFGENIVLTDIYALFEFGQITSLLGRNGSGKSCIFNIILGSLKPQNASVRFNGKYHDQSFGNKIIKYLPQTFIFPSDMKIKTAIKFYESDYEKVETELRHIKIDINSKFSSLSGGERRIAEIYIYLNCKSPFVILDEPFTYLSPIQINELKGLIKKRSNDKGIIISDHQYKHIIDISDKIYFLNSGKLRQIDNKDPFEELRNYHYIL